MSIPSSKSVDTLKRVPKKNLGEINIERLIFLQKLVKSASYYLNAMLLGSERISKLMFDKVPKISSLEKERNV